MKKQLVIFILIAILISFFSIKAIINYRESKEVFLAPSGDYMRIQKQDIFSLMMAYPEHIVDIDVTDNKVYLVLISGKKLLYDDKKEKNQQEQLDNPDLQDMMSQKYFLGPVDKLMPQDYNPGRIRVYPLLKEVYGVNQSEIEKNLKGVSAGSRNYRFNGSNSAEQHLSTAIKELNKKAEKNPKLWSFIYPMGGTYNYRYISRTNRLSPHAFGIAIDLASNKDDYWQWTTREAGERRLKTYPQDVVDTMESNYFIWGGKWGQFDILHFEYRPEIIIKTKYFSNSNSLIWSENLPSNDQRILEVIHLIEERLR